MKTTTTRRALRIAVLPAAAALAVGIAGPASAHVSVAPDTTAAGAYAVLTFSVPHGCDGAATTEVAIKLPDNVIEATPTRNPFYEVEEVTAALDEPLVAEDGDEITEKVDQVVYTATTALPDGQRDTFELSLQIPEDAAGTTLVFPVIQTCEKGETAWTEVPAEGQSEDDLEHPAPAFEVTEATGEGHHGGDAAADEATHEDEGTSADTTTAESAAVVADDGDDSGNALGIAGLVAGGLGLVVGGIALARTRRTPAA